MWACFLSVKLRCLRILSCFVHILLEKLQQCNEIVAKKKSWKKKLFNECCKIWHMLKNDGGAKTCLRENLQEISKNTGDVVVCSLCGCLGDFHESPYLKPTIASKIVEILLCETRPFSFFTVIVVAWLVRRLSSKKWPVKAGPYFGRWKSLYSFQGVNVIREEN